MDIRQQIIEEMLSLDANDLQKLIKYIKMIIKNRSHQ